MLEAVLDKASVGGSGCKYCAFWGEYGDSTKELHGLVGEWGRCSNQHAYNDVNHRRLTGKDTSEDRIKTVIFRLSFDMNCLDTAPSYLCSHHKVVKT